MLHRNKRTKKRKINKSPIVSPEHNQKKEESQQTNKTQENAAESKKATQSKPPPVIVNKVQNYQDIRKFMDSNQIQYQTTLLNSGDLKVNVPDADNYRKLTLSLNQEGNTWYSYEDKQSRPIKVIAKKLHPSCQPEEIKEDLLQKKLKIKEVTQLVKRTDKTVLPLFMLTFDKEEDVKTIYEIRYILNMKVEIQALRKSRLIPQCKRCQLYGHTHNYCNRDPRCVKCAAKHLTKECKKPRDSPAKCVNCGEPHPASYRGCIVAKELQKMRNEKEMVKDKRIESKNPREEVIQPINRRQHSSGLQYSEVVKTGTQINNGSDRYSQMLQKILDRMDEQEQKQDKVIGSIIQRLTKVESSVRVPPATKP